MTQAYRGGPVEVEGRYEHENLEVIDKNLEVDCEEGLLLQRRPQ